MRVAVITGSDTFLASPESSYATGQSFIVDGGLMLMAAEANKLAG